MASPNPAKQNIHAIAALEETAAERQALCDRISGAISRFVGSVWLVLF